MKYVVHTDGGARGNPGPAAIGVVIAVSEPDSPKSKTVSEYGMRIGETTNNVAEYTAVLRALETLGSLLGKEDGSNEVAFYLDSLLVVNQLNGLFKVKEPHLRELLLSVRLMEQNVNASITYTAVPRAQNSRADYWVNHALDSVA